MKYLKLILDPENQAANEQLDLIIDGLRTTIPRSPIITCLGIYFELQSEAELISEVFNLGVCYAEIEAAIGPDLQFDLFEFEVVELDEMPIEEFISPFQAEPARMMQ